MRSSKSDDSSEYAEIEKVAAASYQERVAIPSKDEALTHTHGTIHPPVSPSQSSVGNEVTAKSRPADKVSINFFQWFAVLVFISGISLGVGGSLIKQTEVVRRIEDGEVIDEVQRTTSGDKLVQGTGFGMAGLAVGSIFFSYAPDLVKGVVQIVGGAITGAATVINKNAEKDEEKP